MASLRASFSSAWSRTACASPAPIRRAPGDRSPSSPRARRSRCGSFSARTRSVSRSAPARQLALETRELDSEPARIDEPASHAVWPTRSRWSTRSAPDPGLPPRAGADGVRVPDRAHGRLMAPAVLPQRGELAEAREHRLASEPRRSLGSRRRARRGASRARDRRLEIGHAARQLRLVRAEARSEARASRNPAARDRSDDDGRNDAERRQPARHGGDAEEDRREHGPERALGVGRRAARRCRSDSRRAVSRSRSVVSAIQAFASSWKDSPAFLNRANSRRIRSSIAWSLCWCIECVSWRRRASRSWSRPPGASRAARPGARLPRRWLRRSQSGDVVALAAIEVDQVALQLDETIRRAVPSSSSSVATLSL